MTNVRYWRSLSKFTACVRTFPRGTSFHSTPSCAAARSGVARTCPRRADNSSRRDASNWEVALGPSRPRCVAVKSLAITALLLHIFYTLTASRLEYSLTLSATMSSTIQSIQRSLTRAHTEAPTQAPTQEATQTYARAYPNTFARNPYARNPYASNPYASTPD